MPDSLYTSVKGGGEWADVGLTYNARLNAAAHERAPATTALLLSECGGLLRDATSCPLGSSYLSLLRPHTQLTAHCGPTNCRLRAHLGLVVPAGECFIRCGSTPPRRWEEGEVLLFDDSFEHEVWNATDEARLVLIVDLWHPQLRSDEERMRAIRAAVREGWEEEQCERYRKALGGELETTVERGH